MRLSKGKSCTDMIFVVRQLMEKSWEHRAKTFFTFVDLKKAHDSVPRRGMWLALKKFGVPEKTVNLIRAFHTNLKAKISLNGELLEDINVENGLRQGCCMAPVPFNLYTTLVIERWQDQMADSEEVGATVQYKQDKKLFRRYTKNANKQKISECLFADDGALLASSRSGAETAATVYQETSRKFGLTVHTTKTKHMVVGREATSSDEEPLTSAWRHYCIGQPVPLPWISGRCLWKAGCRCGQTHYTSFLGFWCSEEVGLYGQGLESSHQEGSLPSLCTVCSFVWIRMLDTP